MYIQNAYQRRFLFQNSWCTDIPCCELQNNARNKQYNYVRVGEKSAP